MADAQKRLDKAPDALGKALAAFTPNLEREVPEGLEISSHLMARLDKRDAKQVKDYLDGLLKDKAVTDRDLKTLFERHAKAWEIDGPSARAFFEGLHESVREKAKGW